MGNPTVLYLRTYVVQVFVIVIDILIVFVVVVVIIVLFHHIVLEGLSGEVINGFGNDLFLDVLAELVIQLELLIQFVEVILVDLVVVYGFLCGRDGGSEEVEEGLGGAGFANQPCAIGVCERQRGSEGTNGEERGVGHVLLFLCFFISNSFVRSLSSFHVIVVPMARS